MWEYQNIKRFLPKVTPQIGQKFLSLKNPKILYHEHMLSVILTVKKLLECSIEKNCKKINQTKFNIEKVTKKKGAKLYIKWKSYDNSFNS